MSLGVRIIRGGGQAKAVAMRPRGTPGSAPLANLPAIVLERGGQQPRLLLTPLRSYQPGSEYLIESPERNPLWVRAGRLVEATASFERFEIEPV